jgi:hypothetical protein
MVGTDRRLSIMDHTYIEERGLIDLYHRGQIPPEEEIEFEEHFVACAECQERLESARGFQRGLKTVVAEDAARVITQAGVAAWLFRRRWLAAALIVFLVAALPVLGFLAGSWGARDLGRAVVSWKEHWESERRSADKLSILLAESEHRRQEERRQLEEKLAQVRPQQTPAPSPLVNTPLILLTAVRGESGEAPVVQAGKNGYFSLAVDAGDDPRFESYRVTVTDSKGAPAFRQAGLKPNALEAILLTFPASFFKPGEYRLALEGVRPDGAVVELGVHPFRVVR